MIKKLLKSSNIKNSIWIISEQIFQMLISLIIGILSARYLGPSNYGILNYTASFVTFVTSIATLGMEGVVVKRLIAIEDKDGEILGSCIALRLISSLLSSISIILIVFFLNPNEIIKTVLVSIQSMQLIFKSFQIIDSWFQRYLKSKYVSIGKIISGVVVAAYKIFLLITAKDIIWFAFSNVISDFVISIMLLIFYKNKSSYKLRFNKIESKIILKDSYHFMISGIMVSIYAQMDKIMIGEFVSDEAVGFYTSATVIAALWIFIPNAIINSFRPMIFEIKKANNNYLYDLRLKQLYSFIIWISFFASFFVWLLAKYIVILLYGKSYLPAVSALRIVTWCETFAIIGSARSIWILCENKNKYVKYYLFIGVLVNAILNFVLIPIAGIEGAAIATLVTQLVTSLIAPLLFKETRKFTLIAFQSMFFLWFKKRKGDDYVNK